MKILLVEDNAMIQDMLKRRLERREFRVRVVGEGASVLSEIVEEPPDVILLDIGLPDMTGIEVVRRLKQQECACGIPVVALSSHVLPGSKKEALEAGCVEFVDKPIDFSALLDTIHRVGGGSRDADD